MEKRIAQINEEFAELRSELEGEITEERMAEIEARQAELEAELKQEKEVEARKADLSNRLVPIEETKEERKMENTLEMRAQAFKENKGGTMEMRSLLVYSGSQVATPTGVSGINDTDKMGGLLDIITITDCTGMGAYKIAYEISDGAAVAVTEGSAITGSTEASFGFQTVQPADLGVINYVGRDVAKQSPLNYQSKVTAAAMRAVQKAAKAKVITAIGASTIKSTATITAIDKDTIDTIVLNYGGDEAVAGDAYLILNKKSLKALAAVKGKNEYLPVYNIIPDAGTTSMGTIKVANGLQTRYCIDSNVADDTFIYGNPKCAELCLFGDMEVAVSEDAAFTSNLLTVRGIASVGAAVNTYHGFEVVTVSSEG